MQKHRYQQHEKCKRRKWITLSKAIERVCWFMEFTALIDNRSFQPFSFLIDFNSPSNQIESNRRQYNRDTRLQCSLDYILFRFAFFFIHVSIVCFLLYIAMHFLCWMGLLTSFLLVQILFTWFGVLDHNFFLDKVLRCVGFSGVGQLMLLLLLLPLLQLLLLRDCVTYCWFDAIRCDWRVFIVIRCTSSWIANVEKWFIMGRRRDSWTIKIKPMRDKQMQLNGERVC